VSRFLISSTFLREATGVSIVCTFSKIGIIKLPGAIGTIKLPQRQINGSSYKTNPATFVNIVAGHTGQSSQLFPVAPGRNAQFLATVARKETRLYALQAG
jgi:hypothetical protein